MKKIIFKSVCIAVCCIVGALPANAFSGSGAGTAADPYQIVTAGQLNEVRNEPGKFYKLMNDIDLTGWLTADSPIEGWLPISNFSGNFNGNGHFITGLRINRTSGNIGLFGSVTGNAEINNLGVATAGNDTVKGTENVGILIGGINGAGVTVSVNNCAVIGNVMATSRNVGAFLGFNNGGNITIENTYATGSVVSAGDGAGGLIGNSWSGSGAVSCNISIQKSYAANSVSSTGAAGGLLGGASASSSTTMGKQAIILNISNSCAANSTINTTSSSYGRIYGYLKTANATVTLNNFAFAKTEINDIAVSGTATDNNGEDKSASELAAQATFEAATWDFTSTWQSGNGNYELPVLKSFLFSNQPTASVLAEPLPTLTLPDILSGNMILQRNTTVRLWGKAVPNKNVHIVTSWDNGEKNVTADAEGLWETTVSTGDAGGPYSITFSSEGVTKSVGNILLGEVWICAGQSNMAMPLQGWDGMPIENSAAYILESASHNDIRMFTANRSASLEPQFNTGGTWQPASASAATFSAVGYLYALELQKKLDVPVGMIHLSWPGSTVQAWTGREVLQMFPEVNLNISGALTQRTPTGLYNGMFHPVSKYSVKGVIWYQGEDNVGAHALYAKLFPAFVRNWRMDIGRGDIPFYYVELAPYKYQGSTQTQAALLREVQFQSQDSLANVALISAGDLGEEEQIHPAKKYEIAQRLAYRSLLDTYGYSEEPYTHIHTPVCMFRNISGNTILLTFGNIGNGLAFQGDPATAFEIAGENKVYYPANASITGNRIEVRSSNVPNPKEVRYAFRNYFQSVLFNNYGIPLAPFRTDNLPAEIINSIRINDTEPFVYPNPVNEKLFVKTGATKEKRIYNMSGNIVLSSFASELDLSALPSGVYFLAVNGKIHKIVKL
ncbi:MAG: T9SS type A sorting domain-containing protein [Dysgonamonadaceae bacterium]|jgi:sialate O-acetylesterase|nr:T9SS type A sorting domain-containing protein [Dysgonamonadaceae bacterium]